MTSVEPAVDSIEALDFEVPCVVTIQCNAPADWIVRRACCGSPDFMCTYHVGVMQAQIREAAALHLRGRCARCGASLPSAADLIASIEPIR